MLGGGENDKANPMTYTIETPTFTLKDPTGQHSFIGWYKDAELRQKVTTIPAGSHENLTLYAGWQHVRYEVKENVKESTCTEPGSYDSVIYCSVCSAELGRTTVIVKMKDHTWNSEGICSDCGCSNGLSYNINSAGTGYILTGRGECTHTDIVIPSSYRGLPVVAISAEAFRDCTSLASIAYSGTKAQWRAISKKYDWNYNTGNYTIYCTDGNLEKE